jgi:hypothetical protein
VVKHVRETVAIAGFVMSFRLGISGEIFVKMDIGDFLLQSVDSIKSS